MDIDAIRADFERDFTTSVSHYGTLNRRIVCYLEENHWNTTIFVNKTNFNRMMYTRLKNPENNPSKRTIITLCMAFNLTPDISKEWLMLGNHALCITNRTDFAYLRLLERHVGLSIPECNDILRACGVALCDMLGSIDKE